MALASPLVLKQADIGCMLDTLEAGQSRKFGMSPPGHISAAGNLIARLTAVDGNQGIFTKRDIPRGKQYSVDWVQLRTYLQSAQLFDPYAAG